MSFLLMCCVNGINNFRKENKMRKELQEENKNKKKKKINTKEKED